MATTGIDCDDELFTSLLSATPDEVDTLVDIITDFSRGRAGLDADVKKRLVQAKHSSRPAGYDQQQLELLGHELQQFGGHSAMNLTRRFLRKSAVPYAEIVNDVYQKLNGSEAANRFVAEKERQIALALFGADWRELAANDRCERATSTKVLTGLFNLKDALSVSSGMAVGLSAGSSAALFTMATTGFRLNPIGAVATVGFGLHSSIAEAYRVTVPFVAQMGWIRLRREAPAARSPVQTNLTAASPPGSSELVVENGHGAILLKLNTLQRPPAGVHRALPTDQISALSPLLANVPGLAALGEMSRGNYVVCSLPFETLTKNANNANNDGSVRAFVRTGGKISKQASLSLPEDLQSVLLSGAVWSVVSSAVGQKHLHDINEKLNAIKRQLDSVLRELDEAHWESLAGMVDYTQDLLDHYAQDGISHYAVQTLESQHSQITALRQFFDRKMKEELNVAHTVQADKLFGADSARQILKGSLAKMEGWVSGYLQAAQLQIVSSALRYMADPQQRHYSAAAKVLASLAQLEAITTQSRTVYSSQMELTRSRVFKLDSTLSQSFTAQLDSIAGSLTQGPFDTRQLFQSLFNQGEHQVLLRYQDGQIAEAQLLEQAI